MSCQVATAGRFVVALFTVAFLTATLPTCATDRLDHGASQGATVDGGQGDGGWGTLVSGSITGDAGHVPPSVSKCIVVWQGGRGGLERVYKLGEGTATATRFSVSLSTAPPAEAMVNGETGVAFVYLVPSTLDAPDGVLRAEWLEQNAIGAAPDYLVVYRGPLGPAYPWQAVVPTGFSCVRRDSGELHAHTRTDCGSLESSVAAVETLQFVLWN